MEETPHTLVECIKSFIGSRLAVKLEDFDKSAEKKLQEGPIEERVDLATQLADKRNQLLKKYQLVEWLSDAASRAWQISIVTHAPKYTHSDTKSMGVLLQRENLDNISSSEQYLCSMSLDVLHVDVAGNAAALDVAALLNLRTEEGRLRDQVARRSSPALQTFATSDEQLQEWLDGFNLALSAKKPTSGQLAKQLYFPLEKNLYHLLSPLYSSSLSQALYNRLTDNFYSDPAKAARKARKSRTYHQYAAVTYPGIAIQGHGGANQQNISQLNANRYGRSYLLSSQPPTWKTQQQPPQGKNSFWREYEHRAWKTAQSLRRYLENISDKASTKGRRDKRSELVDELVDKLLFYAAEVQHLKDKAGWSQGSDLSKTEQLWLDPHRANFDLEFKLERDKNDWQVEIAKQFAGWLNHKLSSNSEKLFLGDAEFDTWKKLLADDLGGGA